MNGVSRRAVDLFWERCDMIEPFPRNLDISTEMALPVKVVQLTPLQLHRIENWLGKRDSQFRFNCRSRAVQGCLVAYGGKGFIFLDSSDNETQRRFTLAHEIGHFLVDYWLPRQDAIGRFGAEIVPVLDGHRVPTPTERLQALFNKISIGIHTDLMERSPDQVTDAVWKAEDNADKVALELLAPTKAILPLLHKIHGPYEYRLSQTTQILCGEFGFPLKIAEGYSVTLLGLSGKNLTWVDRLGLK